ncbi:MAG: DUF3426 domain-containing protein [Gammaproteobacteria bacterium]|nr:DUF3426 domain-containing protein [Gammaproteobacteria bacterium]
MYTQCPHCQTCFRISEAHLNVANGKVRCGSCQEVFDATQHLFKNLTDREPITYQHPAEPAPPPPPPKPVVQPTKPPVEPEHFEVFTPTPPDEDIKAIRKERAKAPDQTVFMDSLVGNDRYNNLDQMGSISIPGDIDFGDSIIKFNEDEAEEEPEPPAPKPLEDTRTPYEDIDSKEADATDADHASILNFYSEVDSQLSDKADTDLGKSQLDKDIDELLAFAKGLDFEKEQKHIEDTPAQTKRQVSPAPDADAEEIFDLQVLADFEKELEATNTGVFAAQAAAAPADEQSAELHAPPEPETEQSVPDDEVDFIEAAPAPDEALSTSAVIADKPPLNDEDIPLALRRSLDNLSRLPRRSIGQIVLMSLIILILIGGLGFQVVLFRNVQLAQKFPQLIPMLSKVCDDIPCRYSGKIDVSQIKLISRDVSSHPTQANALLISAAFVNQAPFDQPYPIIQITLYDLSGNVVASRRFTPQEYLQDMYNRFLLMESGTPVHVTLAVLDPGKDAINFEFSFL